MIQQYTDETRDLDLSLELPSIGNYCLARVCETYRRAKILDNSCKCGTFFVRVFCCDTGLVQNCCIEDIIEIPQRILDFLPFQAIHCSLDGLEPLDASNEWSEDISDRIYDQLNAFDNIYAKVHSIEKMGNLEADILRYNVTLSHNVDGKSVNLCKMLVNEKLAKYRSGYILRIGNEGQEASDSDEENWDNEFDPNKRNPWLCPVDYAEKCEINEEDFDCHFEAEDFREMCANGMTEAAPKERNINNDSGIGQISPIGEKNNDLPRIGLRYKHLLRSIYKPMQITWQQSASLLVLTIKANENVSYDLEATADQISVW